MAAPKKAAKTARKSLTKKVTKAAVKKAAPKPPSKKAAPSPAERQAVFATPATFPPKHTPLAMLTSWSYSVYTQYMKCPLSVCFDKIKRIRIAEPPNPAFIKGNAIHKFAEEYVTGTGKAPAIIPELKAVKDRLGMFRKMKALAEQDWAFTKDYIPTRWNDWDKCWLRIKVDVCAVTLGTKKPAAPALVHITDWKSGKIYEEHKQQRSLYALGGLQLVELGLLADGAKDVKVVAEHLYTDTTQSATEAYTLKDLKPLKSEWASRIKQMMSDTRYPAKTGFHCRYCKFRKSAGGPCPEDM